jgi:hypothetical protein
MFTRKDLPMRTQCILSAALLALPFITYAQQGGVERIISSPASVGPVGKRKLFPTCQTNQYLSIDLNTGNPICKTFTACGASDYVSTNSTGAMICKTIPECTGTNRFLTFQGNTFVCGAVTAAVAPPTLYGGGGSNALGAGSGNPGGRGNSH